MGFVPQTITSRVLGIFETVLFLLLGCEGIAYPAYP